MTRSQGRAPVPRRRRIWLLAVFLGAACTAPATIDGRRLADMPVADVVSAAEQALAEGRFEEAARAAEWVLERHYEAPEAKKARVVAAEARFAAGDWRRALAHDRRLLDEDPLTPEAPKIERRLWTIGREWIREEAPGIADFSAHHDVGVEALNLLVTRFPRGERADDAWKELALAFVRDGEDRAAIDVFERLARDYPESEWTDLALWRVVECYRRLTRGAAFDVDPLLRAEAAADRYLARFPDGNFVAQVQKLRAEVREEIARHELEVAAQYAERGRTAGERLRLTNVVRRFPETEAAERARRRLEEIGGPIGRGSAERLRPSRIRPSWRDHGEGGNGGRGR